MPNQWGGIIGNSTFISFSERTYFRCFTTADQQVYWLAAVRAGGHLETSVPPLLIIYYTNPKIFTYISDRRRHAFYYSYTIEADAVLLVLFYLPTDPYFPPSHLLVALFCRFAELASSTLSILCFMKYMSVHSPIPIQLFLNLTTISYHLWSGYTRSRIPYSSGVFPANVSMLSSYEFITFYF